MTVTLAPAVLLEDAALAGLFSDVYAGYWHPIQVDAAALRRMVALYDLDLESSHVALVDGTPVGVALLGVRGEEAWLGGMGVLPERRGAGIGELLVRRLVETARDHGVRRVRLEVLEQNAPARAIYERVGFTSLRSVGIWRLDAPPPGPVAGEADLADTAATLYAVEADAPWQRSPGTVERMRSLDLPLRAVARGRGNAIVSIAGDSASLLLADAASRAEADALLAHPFAHGAASLLWLNAPDTGIVTDAMRAAGARRLGIQEELELLL